MPPSGLVRVRRYYTPYAQANKGSDHPPNDDVGVRVCVPVEHTAGLFRFRWQYPSAYANRRHSATSMNYVGGSTALLGSSISAGN